MWGRLFTGTSHGHNDNLAQEFDFARRFTSLSSQDPESASDKSLLEFAGDQSEERDTGPTSSELFEHLRKELDSIVASHPTHFVPEMNEIKNDEMFHKSPKHDSLFELVDLKPDIKMTASPKKRRRVTFVKRIEDGKFLRDPSRLTRELMGETDLTEDLTENAVWARVGNGRVKIFPLSFGMSRSIQT